jgi:hypothetical protein
MPIIDSSLVRVFFGFRVFSVFRGLNPIEFFTTGAQRTQSKGSNHNFRTDIDLAGGYWKRPNNRSY